MRLTGEGPKIFREWRLKVFESATPERGYATSPIVVSGREAWPFLSTSKLYLSALRSSVT
jgi:hypothetical protein